MSQAAANVYAEHFLWAASYVSYSHANDVELLEYHYTEFARQFALLKISGFIS